VEKSLRFTGRATREVGRIYSFYEVKSPQLAQSFFKNLQIQFDRIKKNPEIYQERKPGIRAAVLSPYPYLVFYSIEESSVDILAVVHQSRSEDLWP
jgi:toxin ParE1/3/4